jgi:hypothetical protein
MFNRRSNLSMEKLEDRQMMAGDIAVNFSQGTLSITEAQGHAGEDNVVAVSMMANGNLRVVGQGVDRQFNAASIEDINILLGGGNDTLTFQADLTEPGVPNYGTTVFIDMGNGGSADWGDVDRVEITNTDVQGLVQIAGGWAEDTVSVNNTRIIGDGLVINTGSSADHVYVTDCELSGLAIQTYQSAYEAHNDYVEITNLNMESPAASRVQVRMGGGVDYFRLQGVHANVVDIDAGDHNDVGTLAHIYAIDELMANMGDGNDALWLQRTRTDHLSALGGAGTNDRLFTLDGSGDNNRNNTRTITGWESINPSIMALREFNTTPKTVKKTTFIP